MTHLDEVLGLVWVKFSCHGRAWRKRRMGTKKEVREKERSEDCMPKCQSNPDQVIVVIRVRRMPYGLRARLVCHYH